MISIHQRFGTRRVPTIANGGISSGILFSYPGLQASTDTAVADVSGRGRILFPGADMTVPGELWSVANAFSGGAAGTSGQEKHLVMGGGRPSENWYEFNNGDNFLFSTWLLGAVPTGAGRSVLSFGQASQTVGFHGFRLAVTTGGLAGFGVDHAGGVPQWANTDAGGAGSGVMCDGANWYHISGGIWGHTPGSANLSFYLWINSAAGYSTATKGITNAPASIVDTSAMRVSGRNFGGGSPNQQWPWSFRFLQAYRSPSSVVLTHARMEALARRLYLQPAIELTEAEWPTS